MATRSRKRRSCKHRKPVRTKKGGKRKKRKSRRKYKMWYTEAYDKKSYIDDTPQEILSQIVSGRFNLMELLELRTVNSKFRDSVDDILRSVYNKIYGERSPNNIIIVILRLKQALLPPFRTGKSKYHYREFNSDGAMYLNYPLWADATYTDAEKTAFKEKLKKKDTDTWYGWPFVLEFLFSKNDRDYYDYLEPWSEASEEREDIPGHDFRSGGNTGWDDLANHINNPDSDIYKLMEEYIPEELVELGNIFKELEKNNSDFSFQRLFDLIGITSEIANSHGVGGDTTGPASMRGDGVENTKAFMNQLFFDEHYDVGFKPAQLQLRYVNYTINTLDDYKVGDYFIFYNYYYPTRQYYNISMVGYDIDTNKKVAITDGEGRPYPPRWLVNQFNRIGLDFSYPEKEIMESGVY